MAPATTDLHQLFLDGRASLQVWERENAPDNSETLSRVKKNIKTAITELLTSKQRTYLLAYYFEGLSMEEIAAREGVNKSTVSRTVKRARARLDRVLRYSF